jgi:hypothetical protein
MPSRFAATSVSSALRAADTGRLSSPIRFWSFAFSTWSARNSALSPSTVPEASTQTFVSFVLCDFLSQR